MHSRGNHGQLPQISRIFVLQSHGIVGGITNGAYDYIGRDLTLGCTSGANGSISRIIAPIGCVKHTQKYVEQTVGETAENQTNNSRTSTEIGENSRKTAENQTKIAPMAAARSSLNVTRKKA